MVLLGSSRRFSGQGKREGRRKGKHAYFGPFILNKPIRTVTSAN